MCFTLSDVDECALNEDNCHDTLATCTDVVGGEGSFQCTCIPGYTGDGVTCTGVFLCPYAALFMFHKGKETKGNGRMNNQMFI